MRPTTTPEIKDQEFRMRPLEATDANAWFAYLSMPETLLHTSWNLRCVEDLLTAMKQYQSVEPDSNMRFAIEACHGGSLIGTIGFHSISQVNRTAEVAFDLHPKCWGRGIARTCCEAVVDWGFSNLGFVRIQATALESNLRSVRVLEKSGFHLEGKVRNFRMVRGVPRDFWLFSRIQDIENVVRGPI